VISNDSLTVAFINQPYFHALQATGGRLPYVWSLASGSQPLPAGITLGSSGILSGTPTAMGTANMTVQVQDAAAQTATKNTSLIITEPLAVTTTSLPAAVRGSNYNFTLQAKGGTPPYTWRLDPSSSPLPTGYSLSSAGVISGVGTQTLGRGLNFEVRDTGGRIANAILNLFVVDPLYIGTDSLPHGIVARNYYQVVQAFGGTWPYTFSLASGSSLPPGVSIDSGGTLNGGPTAAGTFPFTLQVNDASGQTATKAFSVDVYSGPLITSPPQLPVYISGQLQYSFTFQASGGVPPFTWDVPPTNLYGYPNQLPSGFSLTSAGVFSGSTNNWGSWAFTVRVTDSVGHSDSLLTGLIMVLPLSLSPATLPNGNVGIYYSQYFGFNAGFGPITYGLAAGSGPLPPGLTFAWPPTLFGTPTSPGTYNFTIEVHDGIGEVATQSYSVLIKNDVIITSWNLPYGVVDQAYSSPILAVVGGTPPYSWSVGTGTFPPGLTLDPATSQIAGSPTSASTFSFEIQATDSSNPPQAGLQTFTVVIRPTLSILTTTLLDAAINVYYSATIQAAGGRLPPYTPRIIAGSLPSGINIGSMSDSSGYVYLGGFPTTTGVSNFTVEISDSSTPPATVARDFSIRTDPQLRIDQGTSSFPTILEGQSFTYTFTATGGFPPYIWSVRYAPPGMAVDSASGVFSGAPTQRLLGGVFADVQDSANPPQHASQLFFWRVLELLRIRTSQFPPVSVGVPVRMYPSLTGEACCSYSWSVASGSLPAGLSLTDPVNGGIAGTPTAAGTFNFSLQVKDTGTGSLAQSVTKSLSIVVKAQGQLGRNDSIATATPLSNGVFLASISPADDGFGALHPDNDYYALSADPGAIVIVETYADQQIPPGSSMDSVIEILDAAGVRHATCNIYPVNYTLPCMNDDQYSGNVNSKLYFQVPGTPGDPPVTFYVRVLDWTGMARPDFLYYITISGAN
jgi:hypothetical protein